MFFKSMVYSGPSYYCSNGRLISWLGGGAINYYRCYLIGNTWLLAKCIELLLESGFIIRGVICSDPAISQWCLQKNIVIFSSIEDASETLQNDAFDYLFSVINDQVLPERVVKLPKHLAINYHDSLLPRYAGVHSTSWAILNNEIKHGVSWHLMNDKIDGGAILIQKEVVIAARETAASLNIKSFEVAIVSFKELLSAILASKLIIEEQDFSHRTFFEKSKKPASNGWILWDSESQEIERMIRALYFGSHPNTFCMAKISIDGETYNVTNARIMETLSQIQPGTFINASNTGWQISTKNNDIELTSLKTMGGRICRFSELADRHTTEQKIKARYRFGVCLS